MVRPMMRDPASEADARLRITCVVGARPNFVKAASIVHAARARSEITLRLVHTGQHYDERMSTLFFRELGLPEPDAHLGVGSASHAVQTARVLEAFDGELDHHPSDCLIVVGDVNSTLACALVAATFVRPIARTARVHPSPEVFSGVTEVGEPSPEWHPPIGAAGLLVELEGADDRAGDGADERLVPVSR